MKYNFRQQAGEVCGLGSSDCRSPKVFRTNTCSKGFTLMEVLLAILLGGMLLTAVSSFLVSLINLSMAMEEEPLFDQHAGHVVHFLRQAMLASSAYGEEGASGQTGGVRWQVLPSGAGLNEEALQFRVSGEYPLFLMESPFVPEVTCWLVFIPDEGLYLDWRTDAQAYENEESASRTLLSAYVGEMSFLYYETERDRWEEKEEPMQAPEGGLLIPDYLKLSFRHPDGRERTDFLLIPKPLSDGTFL